MSYSCLELKWYEMGFLPVAIYLYLPPKMQKHQERYLWISACEPSESTSEVNATVWTSFSEGQRSGCPSDRLRSVYLSNPQQWHHIPQSLKESNLPFRCVWITINPGYFDNKLYWMLWFGGCVGVKKYSLPVSGGIALVLQTHSSLQRWPPDTHCTPTW